MWHHAFPSAFVASRPALVFADLNPLNPQSFFFGPKDQPLGKIVKSQFNWFHQKFDLSAIDDLMDVYSQPCCTM